MRTALALLQSNRRAQPPVTRPGEMAVAEGRVDLLPEFGCQCLVTFTRYRRRSPTPKPSKPRPAPSTASSAVKEPAHGSPVWVVVASEILVGGVGVGVGDVGGGAGGGAVPVVGAVCRTTTMIVTTLVVHVGVVHPVVPSFVKTAKFLMISPLVSVEFTTAWNEIAREPCAATSIPDHVIFPPVSETVQVGSPPHVAEPGTYVVPAGTVSVTVTSVAEPVPVSASVSM